MLVDLPFLSFIASLLHLKTTSRGNLACTSGCLSICNTISRLFLSAVPITDGEKLFAFGFKTVNNGPRIPFLVESGVAEESGFCPD